MASRFEYKYLVPGHLLTRLRRELLPYMEMDNFAKKHPAGEYTVRSIYYDTAQFTCYREKLEGLDVRRKFRIRGYDTLSDSSIIFLEIKRKQTNCISKNRAPLYYADLPAVLDSGRVDDFILSFSGNGIEKKDAEKFLYYYYSRNLRPAVLVIYEREAFFGRFDPSLRITIDKNLRSIIYPDLNQLYCVEGSKPAMLDHFIFELKFYGTLPSWVRSLINRYNLYRRALSKYTMTLDSHREFKDARLIRMFHPGFSRGVACA